MESYLFADISASAVENNLKLLRGCLAPGVKLCAVVKGDCYGHGADLLVPVIARHVDWLAVAAPVEAVRVRNLGYEGPLIVFFSPCAYLDFDLQAALEELIRARVTLTVVNRNAIKPIARAARAVGAKAEVHIKVDSGMGRSGVLPSATAELAAAIRAGRGLKLAGLYTHFATADEPGGEFLAEQLRNFVSAAESVPGHGGLLLHAANSAATIEAPQSHLDMVRCGLAVYGYQPAERPARRLALRPAMRLWGRLMQVKRLPEGSAVGYGLTCTLKRASVVGLAPVGYADGYFRAYSNRATMRVRGRDVPVLGRVSMDQTVIDLTDVPGARAGDEAEILSTDPASPHSAENLAKLAGTISYEVTCRVGCRVRRQLVP